MRTLINVLSVNIFLKLYNLINVSRLYVDKLFFLIKKQNAELFLFPKCFFVAPLSYRERVFFELAKSIDEAVEFPSRCATNKVAMLHEQLREENSAEHSTR